MSLERMLYENVSRGNAVIGKTTLSLERMLFV